MLEQETEVVIDEILEKSKIKAGEIFVVGCSSSEIIGNMMGTSKDGETDFAVETVYGVIFRKLKEKNIHFAVQCCEAFAVKHYKSLSDPVVVESINQKAAAGIDIGGVMIGMHIHPVVVPIRLENNRIGKAAVLAARRRPKYVGGERAVYNAELE